MSSKAKSFWFKKLYVVSESSPANWEREMCTGIRTLGWGGETREIGPQASEHEQLLRTRTGEIVKSSQTYSRKHTQLYFDFSQWGLCWIYNLSKNKFVLLLKVCLNIYACVTLCAPHAHRCSSPEEGVKFSKTEFMGYCESPDMDAGSWT